MKGTLMKHPSNDQLIKFIFDQHPVRGQMLTLGDTWHTALENHAYPAFIKTLLGELMAATALLATSLKFQGKLIMQVQGQGPISLMVVESTHDLNLRAYAQFEETVQPADFKTLFGEGYLVLTIRRDDTDQQYQGYVSLEGETVAQLMENYLSQSEQLTTRVWLAHSSAGISGLLLQKMPETGGTSVEGDWEHLLALANTLTHDELNTLAHEDILHRLFHEEEVRLLETLRLDFNDTFSREKIAVMLQSLGEEELQKTLEEQGEVCVTCQFTGKSERFNAQDVASLFAPQTDPTVH
jgi:molecular chaperone Hsp33